jgi:predicted glycoside hydrolase/deacetylase ChbG (UPF0249 family)
MSSNRIRLIVRADDFGIGHEVNVGIAECLENGIVTAASLHATATETLPPVGTGEWALGQGGGFEEAVAMCRQHPEWQIGVHVTLNAMRPVLPPREIPSLVDEQGYVVGRTDPDGPNTRAEFLKRHLDLGEVENEERAQIERLLGAGINIAYLDTHNGLARATPELAAIMDKLAKEYHVPHSRYAGEVSTATIDAVTPAEKTSTLVRILEDLKPGLWLLITHPMAPSPKMKALESYTPKMIASCDHV